jgi:gamma-glutamylcyclotransferase (GGCT)/AIG2-like uncharacterized protein YtfP
MQALYFAYGSNMASRRMRERAPGGRALGRARLDGFRLVADKPGRDGSAKLNIVRDPQGFVWGALWELREADLDALDRLEGGYERFDVMVSGERGPQCATTYASPLRAAPAGLDRGYKQLVLDGAREQRLPPEWLTVLESLPER